METWLGLPLTSPTSDLPPPNHPSEGLSPPGAPSARHGPAPGPLRRRLLRPEGCPADVQGAPRFAVRRTPSREPSAELPSGGDDQPAPGDAPHTRSPLLFLSPPPPPSTWRMTYFCISLSAFPLERKHCGQQLLFLGDDGTVAETWPRRLRAAQAPGRASSRLGGPAAPRDLYMSLGERP